jgi:protein SCO1/2/putative membrane protein
MREQFKQAIERRVGPDVKEGDEFGHGTRLVVVDKNGVIRAMYSGLPGDDPESKERFEAGLGGSRTACASCSAEGMS